MAHTRGQRGKVTGRKRVEIEERETVEEQCVYGGKKWVFRAMRKD